MTDMTIDQLKAKQRFYNALEAYKNTFSSKGPKKGPDMLEIRNECLKDLETATIRCKQLNLTDEQLGISAEASV